MASTPRRRSAEPAAISGVERRAGGPGARAAVGRITRRGLRRPGKLIPPDAARLKSRVIRLPAGQAIEWHSTKEREELIIVLEGTIELERQAAGARVRRTRAAAGHSLFVPPQVMHRVVNPTGRVARYIYVTG